MAKNLFFFKPLRPSTTKISVSLWTLVLNKKKIKKNTECNNTSVVKFEKRNSHKAFLRYQIHKNRIGQPGNKRPPIAAIATATVPVWRHKKNLKWHSVEHMHLHQDPTLIKYQIKCLNLLVKVCFCVCMTLYFLILAN